MPEGRLRRQVTAAVAAVNAGPAAGDAGWPTGSALSVCSAAQLPAAATLLAASVTAAAAAVGLPPFVSWTSCRQPKSALTVWLAGDVDFCVTLPLLLRLLLLVVVTGDEHSAFGVAVSGGVRRSQNQVVDFVELVANSRPAELSLVCLVAATLLVADLPLLLSVLLPIAVAGGVRAEATVVVRSRRVVRNTFAGRAAPAAVLTAMDDDAAVAARGTVRQSKLMLIVRPPILHARPARRRESLA